ncbi:hypothetical protein [Kitasatospora sp. NPDC056531]|uniref:hypothetical protein n=1 Tax=Kitasatospora sp. NPDC056531 TaxID=3345856 RepID=UPI00368724BC
MAKRVSETDRARTKAWWLPPLVLSALALVFIFENRAETSIRVLVPVVTMPLWAALLGIWLVGVVSGLFLARRRRR